MRFLLLLGASLWMGAVRLEGAEPVLTHIHPAGVPVGPTDAVKLAGKFDPWPCKIWTDTPGMVFTPTADAGKVSLVVAADVAPGPHLFRAYNDEGASAPIAVLVDTSPQIRETEPNDDFRSPQILPGPTATCNGRLDKAGDVDSFRVELRKDQVLVSWVDAYLLAAGVDAMLRVVDPDGVTLAFNHDHVTFDPFLVFKAPHDGPYVVQTMGHRYPASTEVGFAGGDECVYRLHVSTEPVVRNTWPLAVPRGQSTRVRIEGWNLATTEAEISEATAPSMPVVFSDLPELTEKPEPQVLAIPSAISGRIGVAGEVDRYSFSAVKGDVREVSVTGPTYGSAIDAWLKILGPDGRELAANDDDGGGSDPRINWVAPADGLYAVTVGDVTHRGGEEYFYRLAISPPAASVAGSIAVHAIKVEAGKSVEVKLNVRLGHGYQRPLKGIARNLPAGVTATEIDVPEKGGDITISVSAATTASPAAQPWQLFLRESDTGHEHPVRYFMASTAENNGVPQGYRHLLVDSTDQLWVTVTPASPPAPDPAPKSAP